MPEKSRQRLRAVGSPSRPFAAAVFIGLTVLAKLRAAEVPVVAGFERFFAQAKPGAEQIEGGQLLLTELNCVACHAAPAAWSKTLPPRAALSLATLRSRLDRSATIDFLRDVHRTKPGSTMPDLISGEPAPDQIAAALSDYLDSLDAKAAPHAAASLTGHAEAGRDLYQSIGCVACHEPAPGAAKTAATSVPLGLAFSYSADGLARFS